MPCPKCGGSLHTQDEAFHCDRCDWRLPRLILQQPLEVARATELLSTGRTGPFTGFISRKTGRPFTAFLLLQDGRLAFEFVSDARGAASSRSAGREASAASDASSAVVGQDPVGPCPQCGGRVYEGARDYRCELQGRGNRPCSFQTGKVILGQAVSREQAGKLLAAGRTDLLSGFVSRKTGQTFAAFLVLDQNGKVGFAFPPREKASGQTGGGGRPASRPQ